VEAGEHAEAAAAVADDEADGTAPAEAGLAGRVLGGDVEVLVEVAVDAPAPARLHAALLRLSPSRASRLRLLVLCVCVCSLLTNVTLKAGSGRDIYVEGKLLKSPHLRDNKV